MKTIFYILSVLVIGASAYFAFENKAKLLNERAVYDEAFATNANVTASIKTTQKNLDDTKQALTAGRRRGTKIRRRWRGITRSQTYQSQRNRCNATIR